MKYTNVKLNGRAAVTAKTHAKELRLWWAITGTLALHPGVPVAKAWSRGISEGSIQPGMDLGRFGMPLNRT